MQSIALIPASDGTTNASLMTVQTIRASGATAIAVNTVAGVPTKFYASMGTPHTFTDPVTSETITVISDATAVDFAGHVDTGQLIIDAIAPGYTDTNGSKVGDIVIIRPVTEWANNIHNVLNQSHNDDGSLKTNSLDAFYKPPELISNYIASGGIITLTSGLTASFTDIVFYINGLRNVKTGVANSAYTASKDTYVDITNAGVLVYTEVANNAVTGFALAVNSLRIARVVTSGVAITTIQQYGVDGLNNLIYNPAPSTNALVNIVSAVPVNSSDLASSNYTSEVALQTYSITVPAGCRRMLVLAKVRVQSQTASTTDLTSAIDYGNGEAATPNYPGYQRGQNSVATSTNTYGGSTNPHYEVFIVTPGVHQIRILGSANNSANANNFQVICIPLGG